MIEYPTSKMEIQIENDLPFIPDEVIRVGNIYGKTETTKERDEVRSFAPRSHYAVTHYIYNNLEVESYYKSGKWTDGTNGIPRFCVCELLIYFVVK